MELDAENCSSSFGALQLTQTTMLALLSGLSIDCMHSFAAGGPHLRSARAVAAMAQPLLSVVGDTGDSHLSSGAEGMLGLLPFEADDALLPGETMRVELSASRYLALLAALAYDGSTIGQLLLTRPRHAAAVAPLLKVLETRRGDGEGGGGSGAHAICMSVRMACVGRVRLSGVGTDALGIATAVASPAFDYDPDDDAGVSADVGGAAAPVLAELADKHDERRELRGRLRRWRLDCAAAAAAADGGARAARLLERGRAWEANDRAAAAAAAAAGAAPFDAPLDALGARRREALLHRGLDAPPAPSLGHLHALWGVNDEARRRRRRRPAARRARARARAMHSPLADAPPPAVRARLHPRPPSRAGGRGALALLLRRMRLAPRRRSAARPRAPRRPRAVPAGARGLGRRLQASRRRALARRRRRPAGVNV